MNLKARVWDKIAKIVKRIAAFNIIFTLIVGYMLVNFVVELSANTGDFDDLIGLLFLVGICIIHYFIAFLLVKFCNKMYKKNLSLYYEEKNDLPEEES